MITTRHIRHDWAQWVNWPNQKSVRTLCGVKSTPSKCGIPGVTDQPLVVQKGGKKVWGWCDRCARIQWEQLDPPALDINVAPIEIFDLYGRARQTMAPMIHRMMLASAKRAHQNGQPKSMVLYAKAADELAAEFPDVTAPLGS